MALGDSRGSSAYELAKRSGIPYSTLNTLLLKGTQPSLPTLRKLCTGLGITLQQFLAEEDHFLFSKVQRQYGAFFYSLYCHTINLLFLLRTYCQNGAKNVKM